MEKNSIMVEFIRCRSYLVRKTKASAFVLAEYIQAGEMKMEYMKETGKLIALALRHKPEVLNLRS